MIRGPCARARVTVVTEVDFWNIGAGHRARILALLRYLAPRLDLTVVLPTAINELQQARCAAACPGLKLRSLNLPSRVTAGQALAALHAQLAADPPHACIIEYLSMGWLRAAVPRGVLTLVDTHDVASQRDADFLRAGRQPPWAVTSEAQERTRLAAFDQVIAISAPDAAQFAQWVGAERVLLAPHAHEPAPQPVQEEANRVLMVGSAYPPNRDGLIWLLREVWPRLQTPDVQLDVVGDVGAGLAASALPAGVHLHGPLDDLPAAYAAADLCVNPVRYGSGLKIKTIEALAHGRALVCTSHGARGLEDQAGLSFELADDAAGFASTLDALLADTARRRALSQAALALVTDRFNAERCYSPLCQVLQGAALSPAGTSRSPS